MIPPSPRRLTPSMRQRAWTDAFLFALGLLVAALLLFAILRQSGRWSTARIVGGAMYVTLVAACLRRGYATWRRCRLWKYGTLTIARLTEAHEVAYSLEGEPFLVSMDALLDGPLRSKSALVVDPRSPTRPLVVSIAMLPSDTVAAALRSNRTLLPPPPRPPNPAWERRRRAGVGHAALLAALSGLAILLAVAAAQEFLVDVRLGCFGLIGGLLIAALLVVLDWIRAILRRRALWQRGIEARATVRLQNEAGCWMRVEVGEVRWEGARQVAADDHLLSDPDDDRLVILLDPHDPEGLDVVLLTDVGRRT